MRLAAFALLSLLVVSGNALAQGTAAPAPAAAAQPARLAAPVAGQVTSQAFIGRWGFVSYWNEQDQRRAVAQARAECGQPYVVTGGPNGGVMLHGADAVQANEMLVTTAEGRTFLVPQENPELRNRNSREVVVLEPNLFVTRFVDESSNSRYGLKVYARCGGAARR